MYQTYKNTQSTKPKATLTFSASAVTPPTLIHVDTDIIAPASPVIPVQATTTINKTLDSSASFSATDQEDICFPIDNTLPRTRTHDIYMKIEDQIGKIYTDQTGRFPVTSTCGNKYTLVAYDYNSNTINAGPIKTRT